MRFLLILLCTINQLVSKAQVISDSLFLDKMISKSSLVSYDTLRKNTDSSFLYVDQDSSNDLYAATHQDSSIKYVISLKNNMLNGIQLRYDLNGVLIWSGQYMNGKRHGKETFFYDNGKPKLIKTWFKGRELAKRVAFTREGLKIEYETQKVRHSSGRLKRE